MTASPWAAIGIVLAAFVALFGAVALYARAGGPPEITRKLVHAGSGLLTLTFPFLFRDVWPVLLLTAASAALIAAVKFVPSWRGRFGGAVSGVERTTLGELYFPVSVAVVFWLARHQPPLLFVIPILVLTLADATCALVGSRYGMLRYEGASKSLEGSIAFLVVAFFCIHVPLLLWTSIGRVETLLISVTLALLVMLLEGSAWRGLDNLFIPIGGYFILRAYVTFDAPALSARLAVTLALVTAIVVMRRRTTLEDDSLVAGAFLCYVAWALMGWRWLVAPLVVFVGYKWLSPRTEDNSRRMHDVPAVLSVWAAALVWLTLAHARHDGALLLPYTVVFAAHLAIFGLSRLASQFRERPLGLLFGRAVGASWAIVMLPFLMTTALSGLAVAGAAAAVIAIALGAGAFLAAGANIRDAPQSTRRWISQAAAAGVASVAAWAIVVILRRTVA
jgi:phytol kinase